MPDARDRPPLVHRRGPDGRLEVAPDWETLVERQIREAMEAGRFDNLPHHGAPLPDDDNPYAGEWGPAYRVLRNARVAPPWIEADKEVRELLAQRDAILERAVSGRAPSAIVRARDQAAIEDLVGRINAAVARLNAEAPTERQHRRRLDRTEELARYDEAGRRSRG